MTNTCTQLDKLSIHCFYFNYYCNTITSVWVVNSLVEYYSMHVKLF